MGNLRLLVAAPELGASISELLAIAEQLSNTANWIECNIDVVEGGVQEDAIAVLRWSAAFLRRPAMREEDLAGTVRVVTRVLRDSKLAPRYRATGQTRGTFGHALNNAVANTTARHLTAVR